MRDLPTGTVSLLFTDIEGSTRLLQQVGHRYDGVLTECRQFLRAVFHQWNGYEVDTQGDAFFVAFARATDAVAAAVEMQRALASHPWPDDIAVRVRMGLHTGEPQLSAEGYVGLDVHHASRIMSAGHGGQVLLSQTTRDLVEHDLPTGVRLRDLGAHRLKDLLHPSHLFQLVISGFPADFPPLKTLDTHPNNLPIQPNSLIGREKEVAAVQRLLGREDVRLLTLTGPGGTGKTRLGLQVAADLSDRFADGVFFVNLAPLTDPELVVPTIAQALGVREQGNQPLLDSLKDHLRDRHLLLLLDNFEQVIAAAVQVAELLAACPNLKILVTSRVVLHVQAERESAVPPLSLPDPKYLPDLVALSQYEAVALFIARAQAVKSDFALTKENAATIAAICHQLDGLPLAIELAAGRSKLFSPQALLPRLESRLKLLVGGARDLPLRQQTLRGTIAWSYDLLTENEKLLLVRMAVFRGGCSLEAIESVCSEGLSIDVLDGLASLVDKNLVQQKEAQGAEPRFVMLEMIHEYARERLKASSEEATMRRRHAEYFVELAERAEPELRLAGYDYWSGRLEHDLENIRAVLEWSLSGGDVALGVRLAAALCLFWYGNGYHVEGSQWTQRFLARLDEVPLAYHPRFLFSAGHMAFLRDLQAGEQMLQRMLAIAHDLGDREQMAWALASLGYTRIGEPQAAMPLVEESLALFRELNHQPGIAQALNIVGEIARFSGNDGRARQAYEQCLAVSQQTGETRRIIFMYQNLAFIALHEGEAERARDLGRQGLQLARTMNNRLQMATDLALLAGAISALGEAQQAARLLGASEKALERLGAFHQLNDKPEIDAIITAVHAGLDDAAFREAWAEGRELTLEQAIAQALDE
jgi:predicted ATPase/class 3 adenylate cyclase